MRQPSRFINSVVKAVRATEIMLPWAQKRHRAAGELRQPAPD